ncbi:unnamed protein product, partial [Hapterophycus canaliculatus]
RVGLRLLLPGSFSSIRWFGRGPHENYPDRKASALVARHAAPVSEQLTPYIRPGECGGKTDVRWLEISRPRRRPVSAPATPGADGADGVDGVASAVLPLSSPAAAREPAVLFAVPASASGGSGPAGAGDGEGEGGDADEQRPTSPSLFSFSALPHLAEDLAGVMHPEQLSPRPVTAVSLDHRLMGIGGDDSWSACVHDEFLVRPGRFRFSLAVSPFWRSSSTREES